MTQCPDDAMPMIPMRAREWRVPLFLLIPCLVLSVLLACSDSDGDAAPADSSDSTPTATAPFPDSATSAVAESADGATSADGRSRYTSLENCELVLSVPEEASYSVRHCEGVGAGLKLSESDGRQDLALLMPDGSEYRLHLPSIVGAGFSELGPRAEWRVADGAAPTAAPSHLIVRFDVVEDPMTPDRPVSYLVVSRIAREGACIIGIVEPGPSQNERARAVADENGACVSPDASPGAKEGASPGAKEGASPGAKASLALEGGGLRIFVAPSGSARPIPFGMATADAMRMLAAVQGQPRNRGENAECGASYATWEGGLSVFFVRDRFVGWSIRDGILQTASGIGIGATRAELEGVYDARIGASSLGEEFSAGELAGVLESAAPDARITNLWSGMVCLAR